mmetsp:Transcript_34740/g.69198  ORF Transcript_34740/g.69198 Transcript_34740/m.69198 type:complete len:165 (+) Transcript_34740:465-959(+)
MAVPLPRGIAEQAEAMRSEYLPWAELRAQPSDEPSRAIGIASTFQAHKSWVGDVQFCSSVANDSSCTVMLTASNHRTREPPTPPSQPTRRPHPLSTSQASHTPVPVHTGRCKCAPLLCCERGPVQSRGGPPPPLCLATLSLWLCGYGRHMTPCSQTAAPAGMNL